MHDLRPLSAPTGRGEAATGTRSTARAIVDNNIDTLTGISMHHQVKNILESHCNVTQIHGIRLWV
jgi:hypothetical protein